MMNIFRKSSPFAGIMVILILVFSASGCKSKKKAMEAAKEKARIEQEAAARKQQEEERRRKEEEAARLEAEAKKSEERESSPKAKLSHYFESIASSGNVASANNSINEVLTLFSSPDTPVLIIINESNGIKDYDRPTTIKKYLEYLKDQKKNPNEIANLQFDASGKITEVELRKNQ